MIGISCTLSHIPQDCHCFARLGLERFALRYCLVIDLGCRIWTVFGTVTLTCIPHDLRCPGLCLRGQTKQTMVETNLAAQIFTSYTPEPSPLQTPLEPAVRALFPLVAVPDQTAAKRAATAITQRLAQLAVLLDHNLPFGLGDCAYPKAFCGLIFGSGYGPATALAPRRTQLPQSLTNAALCRR